MARRFCASRILAWRSAELVPSSGTDAAPVAPRLAGRVLGPLKSPLAIRSALAGGTVPSTSIGFVSSHTSPVSKSRPSSSRAVSLGCSSEPSLLTPLASFSPLLILMRLRCAFASFAASSRPACPILVYRRFTMIDCRAMRPIGAALGGGTATWLKSRVPRPNSTQLSTCTPADACSRR